MKRVVLMQPCGKHEGICYRIHIWCRWTWDTSVLYSRKRRFQRPLTFNAQWVRSWNGYIIKQHGSSTSILLKVDATPRQNKKNTKRLNLLARKNTYQLFKNKNNEKYDRFLIYIRACPKPCHCGKMFWEGTFIDLHYQNTIRLLQCLGRTQNIHIQYIYMSLYILFFIVYQHHPFFDCLLRRHGRHLSITRATQFTTTAVRRAQFCWKGRKIWYLPGSPKIMAIQPTPP